MQWSRRGSWSTAFVVIECSIYKLVCPSVSERQDWMYNLWSLCKLIKIFHGSISLPSESLLSSARMPCMSNWLFKGNFSGKRSTDIWLSSVFSKVHVDGRFLCDFLQLKRIYVVGKTNLVLSLNKQSNVSSICSSDIGWYLPSICHES